MVRIIRAAVSVAALLLLADAPDATSAPDVTGLWRTQDGAGVVEIEPCPGGICGWLVGFRDQPPPKDYQGVSECGLEFIYPLQAGTDGEWHGEITDPLKGDMYRADLGRASDGTLHLRGYLGISLFGQTQVWTKYQGRVDRDCSLADSSNG